MKPTSTHCRHYATATTRRKFLSRSALGFGALALGDVVARDVAAGSTARQPRWRPDRPTSRLRARRSSRCSCRVAPARSTPSTPSPCCTGSTAIRCPTPLKADDLNSSSSCRPRRHADGLALPVRPGWPVGPGDLRSLPQLARYAIGWRCSAPATTSRLSMARRSLTCTPARSFSATRASARGSFTGWAARATTCPPSWCCPTHAVAAATYVSVGVSAGRLPKGPCSARASADPEPVVAA